MCLPSNGPALLNIKGMRRFEFITGQQGSHMCHPTSDAPFEHMEVLDNLTIFWCAHATQHKWPESTYLTVLEEDHIWCVELCVCVTMGSPNPPLHPTPPRPTALSHFIICSPAPGCSGTSWPLWIHLLLLFSTDNWLEQWNACVPLAFETLHPVYFPEVSFLLSLSHSLSPTPFHPLKFSFSPPLRPPFALCRLTPSSLTLHPWEGFTWKWHIWLATSVCVTQHLSPLSGFSRGAQLPFSSLTAPTPFCIPVLNEEKKLRERHTQVKRIRGRYSDCRKKDNGPW